VKNSTDFAKRFDKDQHLLNIRSDLRSLFISPRFNLKCMPQRKLTVERLVFLRVGVHMTTHLRNTSCIAVISLIYMAAMQAYAGPADQPATQPASGEVKKITLPEFDTMRADKTAVVLDVRTAKEFAAGHVPGAVNIDWHATDRVRQRAHGSSFRDADKFNSEHRVPGLGLSQYPDRLPEEFFNCDAHWRGIQYRV